MTGAGLPIFFWLDARDNDIEDVWKNPNTGDYGTLTYFSIARKKKLYCIVRTFILVQYDAHPVVFGAASEALNRLLLET